jgi:hypothetical protein
MLVFVCALCPECTQWPHSRCDPLKVCDSGLLFITDLCWTTFRKLDLLPSSCVKRERILLGHVRVSLNTGVALSEGQD